MAHITCRILLSYVFVLIRSIKADNDDDDDTYYCSSYTSCDECSSSSSYCYWCTNDDSCHTIGSWYGCAYGADCSSIEQCQRTSPEYIGFSTSCKTVLIGMSLFAFTAVIWRSSLNKSVGEKLNDEKEENQIELAYTKLDDFVTTPKKLHNITTIQGGDIVFTETKALTSKTLLATIISWFAWENIVTFTKAVVAAGLVTLTITKCPRIPQLNVCASQVDWYSILTGLLDGTLQASINILVSIHNPNSYDVDIDNAEGTFLYENVAFGTFYITPRLIKALSITDDTIQVAFFAPSGNLLYHMINNYLSGELAFAINSQIGITFPSLVNISYSSKLNNFTVDVNSKAQNDTDIADTHLCKC